MHHASTRGRSPGPALVPPIRGGDREAQARVRPDTPKPAPGHLSSDCWPNSQCLSRSDSAATHRSGRERSPGTTRPRISQSGHTGQDGTKVRSIHYFADARPPAISLEHWTNASNQPSPISLPRLAHRPRDDHFSGLSAGTLFRWGRRLHHDKTSSAMEWRFIAFRVVALQGPKMDTQDVPPTRGLFSRCRSRSRRARSRGRR